MSITYVRMYTWHYAMQQIRCIILSTCCTILTLASASLACGVSVWSSSEHALNSLFTNASEAFSPEREEAVESQTHDVVQAHATACVSEVYWVGTYM